MNSVAPLFESGMIWCPEQKFADDVMEECAAFPYGDHDDLVDSTTQAIMRFRQGGLIQHPEDYIDEQVDKTKKELLLMEAIKQLVIRLVSEKHESGIVTTLPKKNVLDFQTMILAEKFMINGIDPNAFKNADQAENMLKQIDEADEARSSGITETQSAKVFDLEGKEIPNTKNHGW